MALRTPLSVTPHLYMGDSTGRPLDKGVVYFGEQDKDPEFYPINLFSDDALTLPLAQPVHTKGGYLYDKGDMVEPHAKEIIYSVKVLDSYGRKVFYKGAMMRNSWNDDVIEQINAAIVASTDIARQVATDITNDAINNTAVEGGVLADTFVTATAKPGGVARTQASKNSDIVSIKDFGAVGDGVTDDTAAFNLAIAANNASVNGITVSIPIGTYIVSEDTTQITQPLSFIGDSRRASRIKFKSCNGLNYDLSTTGTSAYKSFTITGLQILTDTAASGAYTAIKAKGMPDANGSRDQAFFLHNVTIGSERINFEYYVEGNVEWLVCLDLDNMEQATVSNCHFRGADVYKDYRANTSASIGIKSYSTTGLKIVNSNFYFFDQAIYTSGQTEGYMIDKCTIVAVNKGVVFDGLVNPSNNHCITDTHFSTYLRGIVISNSTSTVLPMANFISNCFLMERGENVDKPTYIGMELYVEHSVVSNCSFLHITTKSPDTTAIKITNSHNIISNVTFKRGINAISCVLKTQFEFLSVNNAIFNDTTNKFAGSTDWIISNSIDNTNRAVDYRAQQFNWSTLQNVSMISARTGGIVLGGNTSGTNYIDMKSLSGSTQSFDTRILSSSGSSSTTGQATCRVYAANFETTGKIRPESDNLLDLGEAAKRWRTIYAGTSTISTSDERLKTEFIDVVEAEKKAAIRIKASIGRYQFTDAVTEKGDKARYHFGVGAQTVGDIMRDEGLYPEQYAFYCYDEWGATEEILDDEGNIISEASSAGNRYGIRYEELIMFILAAI